MENSWVSVENLIEWINMNCPFEDDNPEAVQLFDDLYDFILGHSVILYPNK